MLDKLRTLFTPHARRRAALLVLAVVVATAGVACGTQTRGPRDESVLVWGKTAEADILDPPLAANTGVELLYLVYERLVGIDDQLNVVPELAESWRQTSPTTYLFTLRQGATFSNGRAVTADDVVGSLMRLADPKISSFWAGQVGIQNVVAQGSTQVVITLKQPRTSFLAALAASPAAILPMQELSAGTYDPKKQLLGSGPFMVAAHAQDESWTLVRNPHHWRPGLPKYDKLLVRIMPDDAARAAALRDGSIDVTTFPTPDAVRLLQSDSKIKSVVQPTTDYYRLDVNARSSLFQDERLRAALSLSIDRNKIKDVAMAGFGQPTAAASVAFDGVCDPNAAPFAKPDPQRARDLVNAAGAAGKTVEIITYAFLPMTSPIAQVIQAGLQDAGLQVRVVTLDPGAIRQRAYNGKSADFDLVMASFAGYTDPAMVFTWWDPELAAFTRPWTQPDPQLSTLIAQSLSTPPGSARDQALRETCNRIANNANIIPLVSKDAIVAYRTDQVTADIPAVEGYSVPLRKIANFELK